MFKFVINAFICKILSKYKNYMLNRKKIHIGTFITEIEACEAYNKVVIELNKTGCNYNVNAGN
jgi:hypothetical protein